MKVVEKAETDVQVCGKASIQGLMIHTKMLQLGERMAETHNSGL